MSPRTCHFKTAAGQMAEQPLGHLASARISCAEKQHAFLRLRVYCVGSVHCVSCVVASIASVAINARDATDAIDAHHPSLALCEPVFRSVADGAYREHDRHLHQ